MSDEPAPDDPIEAEFVAWGKAIAIETRGRRSGRWRRATIGFSRDGENLLVAAADESADWARNLLAEPRCRVLSEGGAGWYRARFLEGDERRAAIVALILTYGTPAERQGRGPAFSLEPEAL